MLARRVASLAQRFSPRTFLIVEAVALALSAAVGVAALFPGPTEWAFEHVPAFFQDPKSCRDFGWPLFTLGAGLALIGSEAGILSVIASMPRPRRWFFLPGSLATGAWIFAWVLMRSCGR